MAQNFSMTPKQARFVDELQIDHNATQAAIRAGYSERTAAEQGSRLLRNVKVAAAIQAAQIEISEHLAVTADRVVGGLLSEAEGKDDSTASSRVAAWAHLGKHLNLFEDKSVFDGKLTIEVVKFGGDVTDDLQPHDEPTRRA